MCVIAITRRRRTTRTHTQVDGIVRPSVVSITMEAEAFAIFDEEIERTFRSVPEAALAEAGLTSGTDKNTGGEHAGSVEEKHEQQHRGPVKPFDVTAKWNIARKVTAAVDRHLLPHLHLTKTTRKLLRVGERLTKLGIYSTARSKCFKPIIKLERFIGGT